MLKNEHESKELSLLRIMMSIQVMNLGTVAFQFEASILTSS